MRLHEILKANEDVATSIDTEQLYKYRKSLKVLFGRNAVLLVTDVFNAVQYAKIVSGDEFSDAVQAYVDSMALETEQDKEDAIELICFQSIPLDKF